MMETTQTAAADFTILLTSVLWVASWVAAAEEFAFGNSSLILVQQSNKKVNRD